MESNKFLYPLDLQFFAEPNEPNPEGTVDPAAEPNTPDSNPLEDPKKADTSNAIPYERFKAVNDAYKSFKSLGYDSPDELKAQLAKLSELEKAEEERKKAEMSEAERLAAEKEEAAKKAEEAEQRAQQAQESANQRIINTEIRSIARSLNANDPNDVLALLDKSKIELDDEGNVKGVEEAVKAFKDSKPWLFKQSIGADATGGSNPGTNPSVSELSELEKELESIKAKYKSNPRLFGRFVQLTNKIAELKGKK